jgi:hypothetical protein
MGESTVSPGWIGKKPGGMGCGCQKIPSRCGRSKVRDTVRRETYSMLTCREMDNRISSQYVCMLNKDLRQVGQR